MSHYYMTQGTIIKGHLCSQNKHLRELVLGDMKHYDNFFFTCTHTYSQVTKSNLYIDMWRRATQEEIEKFKTTALLQGISL